MNRPLDLAAVAVHAKGWRSMTLPDASPAVELHRLFLDAATRTTVSLVRFPPGWQRAVTGHYDVGEEFVLLSGDLTVSGVAYAAGDWAWLPPSSVRSASASRTGALALALFTGVPSWSPHAPPSGSGVKSLRGKVTAPALLRPDENQGWTDVVKPAPARAGDVSLDVLWPASAMWATAAPGESLPPLPGLAVVRHWPL